MATYSVTHKYLLNDYAVLQLLTPSEIAVGESITVASVDARADAAVDIARAVTEAPSTDAAT
jgi:hypothetical protein